MSLACAFEIAAQPTKKRVFIVRIAPRNGPRRMTGNHHFSDKDAVSSRYFPFDRDKRRRGG